MHSTLVEKHLQLVEATHQARQKYIYENEFMTWIHDQRQGFYSLVEDLIALKNPAFVEEQEVRAIRCVEYKEILTRVFRPDYRPICRSEFLEWTMNPSPLMAVVIPEIWLGPKCNELNMTGVRAIVFYKV